MTEGFAAAAPALIQELFTRVRLLERVVAQLPGAADVDLGPIVAELASAINVASPTVSEAGARKTLDQSAARFRGLATGEPDPKDDDFDRDAKDG